MEIQKKPKQPLIKPIHLINSSTHWSPTSFSSLCVKPLARIHPHWSFLLASLSPFPESQGILWLFNSFVTDMVWWTSWIPFVRSFWFLHNSQVYFLLCVWVCVLLCQRPERSHMSQSPGSLWKSSGGHRHTIHVKLWQGSCAPHNAFWEYATYWNGRSKREKKIFLNCC